jgi:hypothetical protein
VRGESISPRESEGVAEGEDEDDEGQSGAKAPDRNR